MKNLTLSETDRRVSAIHGKLERFGILTLSLMTATITACIPVIGFVLAINAISVLFPEPTTIATGSGFIPPKLEDTLAMIGFSVLWAPVLETFLCQFGVIELGKKLTSSATLLILVSAVLFGLGHIGRSMQSATVATFVGLFLAFTYIHWLQRSQSKLKAFAAVALTHAIHNFYYVLFTYVPASLLV